MLASRLGAALVTNRSKALVGVITFDIVMKSINQLRADVQTADDESPVGTNTDSPEVAEVPNE